MLRLRHEPTGEDVAGRLEEAADFLGRGVGLLGRDALEPGTGLWIHPCKSIHTFGMRFSIDAVFLDRRHRVVRVVAALRPWRMVPMVWRAASVVELPAGRAAAIGIASGDRLRFELADREGEAAVELSSPDVDMKLELVPVPVTDVDRAKAFYVEQAGFTADHDHRLGEGVRFVQLTPPGSACSIVIGTGITPSVPGSAITPSVPGSAQGLLLVVSDVEATRAALAARGVEISEVRDEPWGARHAYFSDPDGNSWQLQQPARR